MAGNKKKRKYSSASVWKVYIFPKCFFSALRQDTLLRDIFSFVVNEPSPSDLVVRMKRANSLNVLNVGATETQDGAKVRMALFKENTTMFQLD